MSKIEDLSSGVSEGNPQSLNNQREDVVPGYGASWSFPGHGGSGPGYGASNPYPTYGPGLFPFAGLAGVGDRPEPGDPLYTANADGLELRLISQQLSGSENYSLWSRELWRELVTKDKDSFLDGTVPIPSDERLAHQWRKCNQLVRTWIGNCLTAEVAARVPPTEDAQKFWENLQEMYGKLDRAKIFTLTQALSDLKQGKLSVSAIYNKLSALWNEIEMTEEKLKGPEETLAQYRAMKDREKVIGFLLVWNENYLPFRSQILAMDPVPPLGRIYQLAVQEESQRLASSEYTKTGDRVVLAAKASSEHLQQ